MIVQNVWKVLSVQEFFRQSNWQGYSQNQLSENAFSKSESSWSCLTVQEFFRQSNWQGQLQVNHFTSTDFSCSLTLSVRQFFQLLIWEGNPEIAAPPKMTSFQDIPLPSSQDLNLSDLSDLF